tara:strand:+ start:1715 stop:2161 length:447 start_codon:yes stop_codon:yes gene_type:complete
MFKKINENLASLNNSKFFAGLIMIMLNIGSKYITIELSKTQEEYLKNHVARQILIFSISWMGTRDILMSLALTAIFIVMTEFLFNENSKFCVIPLEYRKYKDVLDLNGDGVVTPDEIKKAEELLKKAKNQHGKTAMLKSLNEFKLQLD